MKTRFTLLLLLALFVAGCAPLIAQIATDAAATPPGPAVTAPAPIKPMMIGLVTALVPGVIAIIKFIVPRLPKPVLPILAPIVGAGLEIFLHKVGVTDGNTAQGVVCGALGVWLREVYDQLRNGQRTTNTGTDETSRHIL